ncbi:MAG TPA: transposase [Pyrinomonadaceae bacterium]|jgi:REP element-mobilizing transposase RayT
MWNDRDIPLAYLITFRCYGTWLHGDERGSVDRFHNQYKSPRIPANEKWRAYNNRQLKADIVNLNALHREAVEKAVRETCDFRGWHLLAINVRTNHVHTVISIGKAEPEIALNALKTNATRKMREDGCWQSDKSPWAVKGSKRYLWNEKSVGLAIDYVINGQGDDLPDFD